MNRYKSNIKKSAIHLALALKSLKKLNEKGKQYDYVTESNGDYYLAIALNQLKQIENIWYQKEVI